MSTTETAAAASKSTENKRKRTAKRARRHDVSTEQHLEQERLERYDKLKHMATKALHKEAKIVKSFECQKIVRKLKQQQDSAQQQQQRLAHVKAFPLHHVERVCLQRLGIFSLNPEPEQQLPDSIEMSKEDEELVERMLRHKRMVSVMETWNDKVTDYRRWYLRRQERVSNNVPDFAAKNHPTKKSKRKRMDTATSDMFVCLDGSAMEDDTTEDYYGPQQHDDDEYAAVVKKKNRPGQRARKAKAMAIQARKEGRTWDSSMNWRETKKQQTKKNESSRNVKVQPPAAQAAEIASMGKSWKDAGKEHPSWAARQKEQSGIVEFTGKKITFD